MPRSDSDSEPQPSRSAGAAPAGDSSHPGPNPTGPSPQALSEAALALEQGGVVGVPTETVYGLAARADMPAALAALIETKGSPSGRGFTWHAADSGALDFFPELRPLAERLAQRYWPGPLTLVLHGVPPGLAATCVDGWCGVRVPDREATRAVLQAVSGPVVATSANLAGQAPVNDPAEILRIFAEAGTRPLDHLLSDGLLEDGQGPAGQPSSILALGRGRFELLRAGALELAELRRVAGLRLGFVCTGNTCRSPMAGALAHSALAERLGGDPDSFGFRIDTMGVTAGPGAPASQGSLEAMAELGIDLGAHRSTPAASAPLGEYDALYCMTANHRAMLVSALPPPLGERVHLLDPSGFDVPDPYGGDIDVYRSTRGAIEEFIGARLSEWA